MTINTNINGINHRKRIISTLTTLTKSGLAFGRRNALLSP